MSRFLITFLVIYTAMHVLFYVQVRSLFPPRWPVHAGLSLFLFLMVVAPIVTHLLEANGHDAAARLSAWVSYCWMAFVFLAFWSILLLGAANLAAKAIHLVARVPVPSLEGRAPTAALLALVFVVCLYGYGEARWIRVERVTLSTPKLPEGIDRLRIVQISDVHLGLMGRLGRLERILEQVRAQHPDLLVSTGDLIDGELGSTAGLTEVFRQIRPRFGKFAITGNHEYYAGVAHAVSLMEQFGFKVLQGEAVDVDGVINLVGVDDPSGGPTGDEKALLSSIGNRRFTLFLKHRPEIGKGSEGLFDLQLSGHTHLGQIFPFRYVTGMIYPMQNGLYPLKDGSELYTSRGTGTWGPPVRVLAPPEVTVIDLVRTPGSASRPS